MGYCFTTAVFDIGRMEHGATFQAERVSECTKVVDIDGDRPLSTTDWLRYLKTIRIDEDVRVLFDSPHLIVTRRRDSKVEVSWDSVSKNPDTEYCSLQISGDNVSITIK